MFRPAVTRVHFSEQTFLFGPGATGRLPDEFDARGWQRVALLVTNSLRGSDLLDGLLDHLGRFDVHVVDDRVEHHAPIVTTERIAAGLEGRDLDAIVTLGGGSASDTAKGVAVVLAEGAPLEDHCSVFRPPDHLVHKPLHRPKLPIVAVPTTFSGAEITSGAGATNAQGFKRGFWDPKVSARVVVYDADVVRRTPPMLLLTTGMNALAHCAEGLYSRLANPMSSAFAIAGARHLSVGLRLIAGGDGGSGGHEEASAGSALAGLVLVNARAGLHHAICHVLGARLHLAHGVANSIMLPHVLRFNLEATRDEQEQLARAMGDGSAGAGDAADLVADLADAIGVPRRLRDVGVAREALDGVAEATMGDRGLYFNPRTVRSPSEVRGILEEAW